LVGRQKNWCETRDRCGLILKKSLEIELEWLFGNDRPSSTQIL
jgi:hypothetical protein